MVQIVVAGGSGQLGREIVDNLVAAKKHDVIIFSRNEFATAKSTVGFTQRRVNYNDKDQLTRELRGVHTVISCLQLIFDAENTPEKNLIDASVAAGVKRFAPSQWGSASTVHMPWEIGKDRAKEHLEKVNKNGKVLEYTLFQPGLFLDYLAFPQKTAKYVEPLQTMVDFQNRRAIVVDSHDTIMTYTTVRDVAAIVAEAVDLDIEWPIIGGISGNKVSMSQLLDIGETVRGRSFSVEKVSTSDLESGILRTSWGLEVKHQSVPEIETEAMLKTVLIGTLLSSVKGAWDVSDAFNKLLPSFKFTRIDDFLDEVWIDKT